MPAPTEEFLDMLSRRGHEPLLEKVDATIRFEVADGSPGDQRRVRIAHGDITVTADDGPADCVIRADRATFEAIISGRTSVMAELLRGAMTVFGNLELMVLSRRLIYPTGNASRRAAAAGEEQAS